MKKLYAILVWIFTATFIAACNEPVIPPQLTQNAQTQSDQPANTAVQPTTPAASGYSYRSSSSSSSSSRRK